MPFGNEVLTRQTISRVFSKLQPRYPALQLIPMGLQIRNKVELPQGFGAESQLKAYDTAYDDTGDTLTKDVGVKELQYDKRVLRPDAIQTQAYIIRPQKNFRRDYNWMEHHNRESESRLARGIASKLHFRISPNLSSSYFPTTGAPNTTGENDESTPRTRSLSQKALYRTAGGESSAGGTNVAVKRFCYNDLRRAIEAVKKSAVNPNAMVVAVLTTEMYFDLLVDERLQNNYVSSLDIFKTGEIEILSGVRLLKQEHVTAITNKGIVEVTGESAVTRVRPHDLTKWETNNGYPVEATAAPCSLFFALDVEFPVIDSAPSEIRLYPEGIDAQSQGYKYSTSANVLAGVTTDTDIGVRAVYYDKA